MTSAIRWEPIEDLKALRDMVRSTFRLPRLPVVGLPALATRRWQLLGVRQPVDVYETPDAYVAQIDVPGVESKDLDITVSGNKMIISGRPHVLPAGEVMPSAIHYLYHERPRGQFAREVTVPPEVEVNQIEAKLEDGVLTVTMPKQGEAVKIVPQPVEVGPGVPPPPPPVIG